MNYFNSSQIKIYTQQIADAICSVFNMQVTIVDNDNKRVAGTGCFSLDLNKELPPIHVFTKVIRTGERCLIENPGQTIYCKDCLDKNNCKEKATILVPVKLDGQVIGGIGLAAMTDDDKITLLDNIDNYTDFMEKMADLLAAKVKSELSISELSLYSKRFETVVDTFTDGILSTDADGILINYNRPAELILKKDLSQLVGKNINEFLSCPLFDSALATPVNIDHQRTSITIGSSTYPVVATVRTIVLNDKIEGFVAFFQEVSHSRKKYESIVLSDTRYTFDNILGESIRMKQCIQMAKKVSASNSTVLILGESGTGKELFARSIHNASNRCKNNFIAINCSAIPDALLESELFGYEGGSFTGAKKDGNPGKFEIANGGTIFLDEIGDMPLNLQAKLLRVLQDRAIVRLGSSKPIPIDVRIIAATNKNLEELINQNLFRSDLYYRISVIPINIPPFRERKDDIPIVSRFLLKKHSLMLGKNIFDFEDNVLQVFYNYDWPGNVRELENVIEYAVNMEITDKITLESLPTSLTESKKSMPVLPNVQSDLAEIDENISLKSISNQTERNQIINALSMFDDTTNGKKECAKYLKISLSTLYRKLKEYEIH